MVACAAEVATAEGFGGPGDIVAIAAGMPFQTSGTTNLLRIARLEGASSVGEGSDA
jgi:pyruvate kinase